jgi:hypothetical protein
VRCQVRGRLEEAEGTIRRCTQINERARLLKGLRDGDLGGSLVRFNPSHSSNLRKSAQSADNHISVDISPASETGDAFVHSEVDRVSSLLLRRTIRDMRVPDPPA